MALLTYLFLPITVAYVLRADLFEEPWYLGVAFFAVFSDFDKLFHAPGLFHSLLTLGPIAIGLLLIERWYR